MSGSQLSFGNRFWCDLAALFPAWLINSGMRQTVARQISVGIQGIDSSDQFDFFVGRDSNPNDINAALGASNFSKRPNLPIDVFLSKNFFLKRSHQIPKKARKDIYNFLNLNLSQNTPFSATEIVWRHDVASAKGQHINVNQYLIKQDILSAIKAGFTLQSWKVRSVRLQDSNLIFLDHSQQTNQIQRFWNRLTVIIGIVAITATLTTAYLRYDAKNRYLEHLASQTSVLQQQAIDLRSARDVQEGAAAQIEGAIQLLNADQQAIEILAALTNDIPDNVWISQISITTNEVRLAGFSDRPPSELVVTLQQNPLFLETRLSGPVVRDRRLERDRFEIVLTRKSRND